MPAPRSESIWEDYELELLKAYALMDEGFERLSRRLGRSYTSIMLKSRELGLDHSPSTPSGIARVELTEVKDRVVAKWERERTRRFVESAKEEGYWTAE